jgi:hypothetical protein
MSDLSARLAVTFQGNSKSKTRLLCGFGGELSPLATENVVDDFGGDLSPFATGVCGDFGGDLSPFVLGVCGDGGEPGALAYRFATRPPAAAFPSAHTRCKSSKTSCKYQVSKSVKTSIVNSPAATLLGVPDRSSDFRAYLPRTTSRPTSLLLLLIWFSSGKIRIRCHLSNTERSRNSR